MKPLLAAVLLPMMLCAQPPLKNTWRVTAVAGPISWPGQKIKLSLTGNSLSFTDLKTKQTIDIRDDEITQVAYSRVRFSRAQQIGGKYDNSVWPPAGMSGCNAPGCGGVLIVAMIATAVAAPMHGTSHFILLTWVDREVEQQIQFEVSKTDAEELNAHLRDLAGVRWVDVFEQEQATGREIRDHSDEAMSIEIDRDSSCGVFALPKGLYRVLVAQNNEDVTVYFFAGALELTRLRAILPAHISDNRVRSEAIDYAPGSSRISSIPWQGKSLEFTAR